MDQIPQSDGSQPQPGSSFQIPQKMSEVSPAPSPIPAAQSEPEFGSPSPEQMPAPNSNLKLWIGVFAGIVVVSIGAVLIIGKTPVYKGTEPEKGVVEETATQGAPATEAPAAETPTEESPTETAPAEESATEESAPAESESADSANDTLKQAASEETATDAAVEEEAAADEAAVDKAAAQEGAVQENPSAEAPPTEATTEKSVFEIGCENNAGSYDAQSKKCNVLSIGTFATLEELTKGIDAQALCIIDENSRWDSRSASCISENGDEKNATLKGSVSDLVALNSKNSLPESAASGVDDSAAADEEVISLPDEGLSAEAPEIPGGLPSADAGTPIEEAPPALPLDAAPATPSTEEAPPPVFTETNAQQPLPADNQTVSQIHGAYIQGKTGPGIVAYGAALGMTQLVWWFRKRRSK